jgi:predicted nucleic acid-binding Zn ribbon protein
MEKNLFLPGLEWKMPNYRYLCSVCGHVYNEMRLSTDPQWKTNCVVSGCNGLFTEITEEI